MYAHEAPKPLTKPKTDRSAASKLKNGATAAYWGYKAFQALRVISGDVTALSEIGGEFLLEGLCETAAADPGMMVGAVQAVVGAKGGVKAFRKNVKNFSQFSDALSAQLNSDGNPETNGQTMESAGRLYNRLMECDRDGSGGFSLEEYVAFSEREGVPRSAAETMFFQADVHGRGQISFEEWTAMMVGRVGRDKDTFNCGGHHGLAQYVAVCNGLACDFCHTPILAGDLAKGCRRCDCDACASCSGLPSARAVPPPPPTPQAFRQTYHEAGVSGGRPGTFDCRMHHGLTLCTTVSAGSSVYCDWCGKLVPPGQLCFGCRTCDMDGCADCAAASLEAADGNASGLTCPGRHGLVSARASGGCVCDFCRAPVAAGAKVHSCRTCGVDACVACVWRDHRRALSTGGEFTCRYFKTHAARPLDITTPAMLRRRCNWCLGVPRLGHAMMRCDFCDCDACAQCVATAPAQEAKVQRVRAAAHTAQLAGTTAGIPSAERLCNLSIGETAGAPAMASTAARGGETRGRGPPLPPCSQPPLTTPCSPPPRYSPQVPLSPPPCYSPQVPLSPPPCYSPQVPLSPPPCYAPRPPFSPPPSYGAVAAPTLADHASAAASEASALPSYDVMAGSSPAATLAHQHAAAISTSRGGQQQLPSYSSLAQGGAGARSEEGSGHLPPPAAAYGRERGVSAPAASAADGAESPFAFDSVVRVLGVEDPEVQGKLLTVIGFEAEEGTGTVVLQRKRRVFRVPASNVYKVMD